MRLSACASSASLLLLLLFKMFILLVHVLDALLFELGVSGCVIVLLIDELSRVEESSEPVIAELLMAFNTSAPLATLIVAAIGFNLGANGFDFELIDLNLDDVIGDDLMLSLQVTAVLELEYFLLSFKL